MKDLLTKIVTLQKLAAKRGLEYIYAAGTKWVFYSTPDKFEFMKHGVNMTFQEDTRHDCPDNESVTLTIDELELSDEDWAANMVRVKAEADNRRAQAEEARRQDELAEKRRQLAKLKSELGDV